MWNGRGTYGKTVGKKLRPAGEKSGCGKVRRFPRVFPAEKRKTCGKNGSVRQDWGKITEAFPQDVQKSVGNVVWGICGQTVFFHAQRAFLPVQNPVETVESRKKFSPTPVEKSVDNVEKPENYEFRISLISSSISASRDASSRIFAVSVSIDDMTVEWSRLKIFPICGNERSVTERRM